MDLNTEYQALARRVMSAIDVPVPVGLYLPALIESDDYRDEFGFVYLDDGTVAPFYVSLPGVLARLWGRYPEPATARIDLDACIDDWHSDVIERRALALGAYNAISQHLMRRADYRPPPRRRDDVAVGDRARPVGMIGYFCPVIDRLRERDIEVLVVEQQPDRVPRRDGVTCTVDPGDLRQCDRVICTASALINDSMADVLANSAGAVRVEVIGPSGSGLPDVLFGHGVDALGGVWFDDRGELEAALARQESWGSVGRKYELTPVDYPGVDALLAAARNRI